jgi:very-short-patch-repair endonuclease
MLEQNMLEKFTHVIPQARILGYSVDLFLPEWSIAVEYQGYQHFQQFFRGDLHT